MLFCAAGLATMAGVTLVYRAVNPDAVLLHKAERLAVQGRAADSLALLTDSGLKFERRELVERLFHVYLVQEQYENALWLALALLAVPAAGDAVSAWPAHEFIARGRFDAAAVFLRQALTARPESRELRLSYARVLSWMDRYDESIKQYRMLLGDQ